MVGPVGIGGDNPLRLQSMTTVATADTGPCVDQILRLAGAGCEIVRLTVPTETDAENLKQIKSMLTSRGCHVPLVADVHFRQEAALEAALHVEKVRINPGNYVDAKAFREKNYDDRRYAGELERIEERFIPLLNRLKERGRALRIGTNHGSLSDRILNRFGDTPEGMVESALEFIRICRRHDYHEIVVSMKASNPKIMIAAYRLLARRMKDEGMDYPFHLGVTEAGFGVDGRLKSAVGIGALLEDGIGDTLRVSLTEEPELEIPVARKIARRYGAAPAVPAPTDSAGLSYVESYYSYHRRATRAVTLGPVSLGGNSPVRVVVSGPTEALLSPTGGDLRAEIAVQPMETEEDRAGFRKIRKDLESRRKVMAVVFEISSSPGDDFSLDEADGVCWRGADPESLRTVARQCAQRRKVLILESSSADRLIEQISVVSSSTADLAVSLVSEGGAGFVHEARRLVSAVPVRDLRLPLVLKVMAAPAEEDESHSLRAAIETGSLLCDGIGDAVQVGSSVGLAYGLLQAAGVRQTRAEYISCPSCGRTLFKIQEVAERISARTRHLKDLKIAIMGCIVNGPGEMADADFGYVGAGPDRVNLYVGRDCVEKGIPADQAVERLIRLIRERGRWTEPEGDSTR